MQQIGSRKSEFACLVLLTFGVAIAVTWVRTATLKETYQFNQKEALVRKIQNEIQGGRLEWIRLSAPKRLEQIAKKLNLGPPRLDQILKVRRTPEQSVQY